MEKIGDIEIRVVGKSGNQDLNPENYDIKHIATILQNVDDLLYPNNKKDRPLITYDLKEGSVRHLFKTTIQTVIGFSALLTQIQANESIDFLEVKTARAIENIQNLSLQKDYEFQIKTSLNDRYELTINPSTKFFRTQNIWADAEFYFYGILKDAGGKNNANFATPPDGFRPRMQMFLWDDASMSINSGLLAGKYAITDSNFTIDGTIETANSGAPLNENPVTADLVLMNDDTETPINGCSESGAPIAGLDGKIVVIRRGDCSFVNKIKLAEDNNAVGVIVVNNTGGNIRMGGATEGINIPAVSITLGLGNSIISALSNSENINVSLSAFDLDGSFDNGIIAHEYGHGISNRLIGGGDNSNCMSNQEQLGEGWSDYFGMAITMLPSNTETTVRGVGTFASGQAITGNGIRRYPYTTDMAVNPFTFKDVKDQGSEGDVSPHGVGSIWATMLWDLHWKMINIYGFDSDMYNGTGGNNKTMSLVIEGLKLTPCSSGFIGARDAILAADILLNNGANQCVIWEVFARRGLGYSADSGDPDSFTDQIEAFDLPPENVLSASSCNTALNIKSDVLKIFTIYPNPATTSINISLTNEVKNANTIIYDINGRQVYAQKSDLEGTVTINTENLSRGIYILKINNEVINYSQKIVIN